MAGRPRKTLADADPRIQALVLKDRKEKQDEAESQDDRAFENLKAYAQKEGITIGEAAIRLGVRSEIIDRITVSGAGLEGSSQALEHYLPDALGEKIYRVLNTIGDKEIKEANLRDRAVFLEKMIDKWRLSTGRGSSQIDVVHILATLTSKLDPAGALPAKEVVVKPVATKEEDIIEVPDHEQV